MLFLYSSFVMVGKHNSTFGKWRTLWPVAKGGNLLSDFQRSLLQWSIPVGLHVNTLASSSSQKWRMKIAGKKPFKSDDFL